MSNSALLPDRPRQVRRRNEASSLALGRGVFLLAFFVSLVLTGVAAHQLLVLLAGEQTEGVITDTYVKLTRSWVKPWDESESELKNFVEFQYQIDNVPRTGHVSVERFRYRSLTEGQPISVRYWPPTNGLGAVPKFASDIVPIPITSILWGAIAWTFSGVAFYQAAVLPRRERKLVAEGIAVPATIVKCTVDGDKSKRYTLRFRYLVAAHHRQDGGNDAELEATQEVPAEFFESHPEGTSVTALFLPAVPQRARLYEVSEYEVISSQS